ncbi:Hypothetical predicted protein [Cloeon dipterum]|uniref:Uncharacterized protein n=1 Tax=Cloeon dipterum TaxID=197152 RepID=A0A8S1CEK9_9INSE|nr:Hypothetical predicted protein [Cloeon dipterum]
MSRLKNTSREMMRFFISNLKLDELSKVKAQFRCSLNAEKAVSRLSGKLGAIFTAFKLEHNVCVLCCHLFAWPLPGKRRQLLNHLRVG